MAALREASGPLRPEQLAPEWPDGEQRERALASLVADGLIAAQPDGYLLPPGTPPATAGGTSVTA